MLQPFILLEQIHVNKLIELKKVYIVTQSYHRAFNHFAEENRTDLLISGYSDPGLAEVHYNAVMHDKYAAILRINREDHRAKLIELMNGTKFRVFWAVTQVSEDVKKRLEVAYKDKIRRFIDFHLGWRVSGDETVNVKGIEVTYGELFVILKWRTQNRRVKFEDIEKS